MNGWILGIAVLANSALGSVDTTDEPGRIAETYLNALEGTGSEAAKQHLLGGVTLTAEVFTIPNWKIIRRDPPREEDGDLATAVREMRALDQVGKKNQEDILNSTSVDEFAVITREQAHKLMEPTRKQTALFTRKFPLFAYVARVDKEVYWHPQNPWRKLLDKLGTGSYHLEVHRFVIAERMTGLREGKIREWPLRVVRMKTPSHDTGWKILPASDWDPEL